MRLRFVGGAVEWGDFDIIQLRYGFPLTPLFEQEGGFSCLALVAQGLDPCWVHRARFWTALTSAGHPINCTPARPVWPCGMFKPCINGLNPVRVNVGKVYGSLHRFNT